MTARHHLRHWLHAGRTTPTTPHDTPATEAANPRVPGVDGVGAREDVLHAPEVVRVTAAQAASIQAHRRAAAVRPVEGLQAHVRVTPLRDDVWARWEVVDGAGRVRAHGQGSSAADAAEKGRLILDILGEGGIDGVAL